MNNLKILLILIIVLLIYNIYYLKENFVLNDKKWLNYRLGDIITGWGEVYNEYTDKVHKKYPNSIGDLYINKTKNIDKQFQNLDILIDIIDLKNKNTKNTKNIIALHLRIGDVILDYNNGKFEYYSSYWVNKYATEISELEKLIPYLKEQNKEVHIYYGSHQLQDSTQTQNKNKIKRANKIYLQKIRDLFNKNNIKFKEKSNGNPDDDFIEMCNSKIFIKSGGSYSHIISDVVEKKGNKVIKLF